MNIKDKRELLTKVTGIANDLGYQVGRLSTLADEGEADMAHNFSNAVGELRKFQKMLAQRIAREESEVTHG